MKCRDFIFLITSGQIKKCSKLQKLVATKHLIFCSKCRNFKKNDEILQSAIDTHKEQIQKPNSE